MARTVTIEGIEEQMQQLKKMMTDDPTFRKRINAVIAKVMKEARVAISQDAAAMLENDPRNAYKAVRSAVYKRIIGGQVNILTKRKAGAPTSYQKPTIGLPSRGGNRWGRSLRTAQMENYEGADRGFVLRFWNAGTTERHIHSYTDRNGERHNLRTAEKNGNRGSLRGHNWFGASSVRALERAADQMQNLIDKIIDEEFV